MRKSGSYIWSAVMLLVTVGAADAQSMRTGSQSANAQQGFGATVVVSNGRIFVGESQNQTTPGFVYAYGRDDSGAWSEMARLESPDSEDGDGFGGTLAVDGGTLVTSIASASAVYVYSADGDGWTFDQMLSASDGAEGDQFGSSVALSGAHLLVGAWAANDSAGVVYSFERDGSGNWTETGKLSGSESTRPP